MIQKNTIIYVVDDDESICKALSLLLKSHGYRVETFTSASAFLAFKHPKLLSCLISDIRLPNINGFALQEAMAQQGIITPVIFITGYGDIPMTVKAMKAGAIDFLAKPFTDETLLNAIILALSKSKLQNKEQIEISRAYERMPNPAIIATQEFLEGKVYYRKNNDNDLFR